MRALKLPLAGGGEVVVVVGDVVSMTKRSATESEIQLSDGTVLVIALPLQDLAADDNLGDVRPN